jgi:hypothetical protein
LREKILHPTHSHPRLSRSHQSEGLAQRRKVLRIKKTKPSLPLRLCAFARENSSSNAFPPATEPKPPIRRTRAKAQSFKNQKIKTLFPFASLRLCARKIFIPNHPRPRLERNHRLEVLAQSRKVHNNQKSFLILNLYATPFSNQHHDRK